MHGVGSSLARQRAMLRFPAATGQRVNLAQHAEQCARGRSARALRRRSDLPQNGAKSRGAVSGVIDFGIVHFGAASTEQSMDELNGKRARF